MLGRYIDNLAMQQKRLQNATLIATAMAFFQRYYLNQTLFQLHPEKIEHLQNACLYLATKVNEVNFCSEAFCE